MKTYALALAAFIPLAGCGDGPVEEDRTAAPETADTAATAAAEGPQPPASPTTDAIPTPLHGRWGLTAADCEPGRSDAKGLLEITSNELEFYESVGTLDDVKEVTENRIRAEFDFIGEGQEWQRDVTLEAQEGGTQLVRRENGADAAPGEFRYTKCG